MPCAMCIESLAEYRVSYREINVLAEYCVWYREISVSLQPYILYIKILSKADQIMHFEFVTPKTNVLSTIHTFSIPA